jgi:CheY-like chemotaxis protein
LARQLLPAAITVDVAMPGMDDWSALSTLVDRARLSQILKKYTCPHPPCPVLLVEAPCHRL